MLKDHILWLCLFVLLGWFVRDDIHLLVHTAFQSIIHNIATSSTFSDRIINIMCDGLATAIPLIISYFRIKKHITNN